MDEDEFDKAIIRSDVRAVKKAIEEGMSVKKKSWVDFFTCVGALTHSFIILQDGKRPVHRAAFNGAVEVLEVLLENGANIKSKDSVTTAILFCIHGNPLTLHLLRRA